MMVCFLKMYLCLLIYELMRWLCLVVSVLGIGFLESVDNILRNVLVLWRLMGRLS